MTYTQKEIKDLLLYQLIENGESIAEALDVDFEGNERDYSEFLMKNGYITEAQHKRWLEIFDEVFDSDECNMEYADIESMTYIDINVFNYDVFEFYVGDYDSLSELSAEEKLGLLNAHNLLNVPVVIAEEDYQKFNEILYEKPLDIMAHYLFENQEKFLDCLEEIQ